MRRRTLYIWVEGADDERFFNSIIKPMFAKHYKNIEVRKWAREKKTTIELLIGGIKKAKNDYLFVEDMIYNEIPPCITEKKQ